MNSRARASAQLTLSDFSDYATEYKISLKSSVDHPALGSQVFSETCKKLRLTKSVFRKRRELDFLEVEIATAKWLYSLVKSFFSRKDHCKAPIKIASAAHPLEFIIATDQAADINRLDSSDILQIDADCEITR